MNVRRLVLVLVSILALAACNSSNPNPPVPDKPAGGDAGKDLVVGENVAPDGRRGDGKVLDQNKLVDLGRKDTKACTPNGSGCVAGFECCTGVCSNKICGGACVVDNAPCKVITDCCNLNCNGTTCAAPKCISDGQSCTTGGAPCCSTKACTGGTCPALNPTCKTAGNACPNGDGDCCSKVCLNGTCASPAKISYCTQVGDICFKDSDCCTAVCTGASGTTAGTCSAIATSCSIDGTVCSGCTGCCSSFCAPFSLAGSTHICQPASGCHVQGDLCHKDSDCCGGDAFEIGKLPGAGLIKCIPDPTYPGKIGTCSDPNPNNCPSGQSCGNDCVPEGNVCHYKGVGGCSSNAIRNDCCSAPGNKGMCQLDSLGVPRCYGLAACVAAGGDCADSADCCNNLPCIPDSSGHLKCLSGATCVPSGGICTTTADCCTGLACKVPPGALAGTCQAPTPPPPPPADGGVKDGPGLKDGVQKDKPTNKDIGGATDLAIPIDTPPPLCALWGQSCSGSVPCCSGEGSCYGPPPSATACAAGETDCTCRNIIF